MCWQGLLVAERLLSHSFVGVVLACTRPVLGTHHLGKQHMHDSGLRCAELLMVRSKSALEQPIRHMQHGDLPEVNHGRTPSRCRPCID